MSEQQPTVLEAGGSISGHVTNSNGDPLANVNVSAQTLPCCSGPSGFASTDAAGNYTINGLPTGNYQVQFTPSFGSSSGLLGEYYNNKTTAAQATPVAVVAGADHPAINASLEQGGSISGHVTNSNGDPLAGVNVSAQTVTCCTIGAGATTDATGDYTIIGLPTGNYQVQFTASGTGLVSEYYDNKTTAAQATPVAVVAGADTPAINASLEQGGSISGHVTNSNGDPLANVNVSAQTLPCCSGPSGFASTDAAGNYTINGLPTGNYQVQFTPSFGGSSGLLGEYYNNKTTAAQATPVAVVQVPTPPRSMPHSSRADRSAVTSPTATATRWPASTCPPKP